MDFTTLCIHGSNIKYDTAGAISVPIFQSATFAHHGVGQSTGFDYSRSQNLTREYLEQTVAKLKGGLDAMAFSSGMAAVTTMMELFSPGEHILASDDLYGGTHRLFHHVCVKNGLHFDYVDTSNLDAVKRHIKPETKAVFIETPTNPMMHITDIHAVARICRQYGILLIVDNTFLTPYFKNRFCWAPTLCCTAEPSTWEAITIRWPVFWWFWAKSCRNGCDFSVKPQEPACLPLTAGF